MWITFRNIPVKIITNPQYRIYLIQNKILSVYVKRVIRILYTYKHNQTSYKFRQKRCSIFFHNNGAKKQKKFVFLHNNDLDILHSNRAGNIHGDVHKFTQIAEDFYSLTWFLNTMAAADDGCDATNMRTRAHQLPDNWVVGRTTWGHHKSSQVPSHQIDNLFNLCQIDNVSVLVKQGHGE